MWVTIDACYAIIMQFFARKWHHWRHTKRVRKPDKLDQVGFGKQQINW